MQDNKVTEQIKANVKLSKAKRFELFESVLATMNVVAKGESTLASKLVKLRAANPDMESKTFYWTFVAFAGDEGYQYRWAQQILVMADIRLRSKRKDEGTKREKKVKQFTCDEVAAFITAMSKKERAKLNRIFATLN